MSDGHTEGQRRSTREWLTILDGWKAETKAAYERVIELEARIAELEALPIIIDTPHEVCDGIVVTTVAKAAATYGPESLGWSLSCEEIEEARCRLSAIEQAAAPHDPMVLIEAGKRLPVTADGVPIAPGMVVWRTADDDLLVTGVTNWNVCEGIDPPGSGEESVRHVGMDCTQTCDAAVPASACYSTKEAAEAARAGEGGGK